MVDTWLQLEFIEEIGQEGRNSKVYRAYDPQLDTYLVAKEIKKSEFSSTDQYTKLADLFNVTTDYLLGRKSEKISSENVGVDIKRSWDFWLLDKD